MVYHSILNTVLCAMTVGPFLSVLTSAKPNLPFHPTLPPAPLATIALFSMTLILFHR